MGTTNWRVRSAAADYFLKQYPPHADITGEAAALRVTQEARGAGVPAPRVIPSVTGDLLGSRGDLALALFEYVPDTTSGVALSCAQMGQAGRTLGRLHAWLRSRAGLHDTTTQWLALDERRKRAAFERHVATIEERRDRDEFDRRTLALLHRRLELLPRAAALLASLPPLARQVVHGDYSIQNILFRGGELVAVVDFRRPELFLPAFEIGRAALAPEMVTADSGWRDKALRLRGSVLPGESGHRAFRRPVRSPCVGDSARPQRVRRPGTLFGSRRAPGRARSVLVSAVRGRRDDPR